MTALPKDLKKYRTKKKLKILIPFAVLFVISLTACILLSKKISSLETTVLKAALAYIVLLSLPFVITGFPVKLMNRSWCGEIVDVNTKVYNTLYKLNNSCTYTKASVILKVKLEDNSTKQVEVFTTPKPAENSFYSYANWKPAGKIEYQTSKYNVGDKVYHLHLFDHLLIESKDGQAVTCIVCGAVSLRTDKKCAICNHSILNL